MSFFKKCLFFITIFSTVTTSNIFAEDLSVMDYNLEVDSIESTDEVDSIESTDEVGSVESTDIVNLYSVTPEDDIWSDFESTEEMFEATQVSSEVLSELSTKDLVELALNHPLACSLFAYDNIDNGIKFLSENSNVFEELYLREDRESFLIEALKVNNTKNGRVVPYNDSEKSEEDIAKDMLINLLLSSNEYKGTLDSDDVDTLNELEQLKAIVPYASYSTVYTPNGSSVSVTIRGEELTSSQISSYNSQYDRAYPNATRLRSATTNYNCHSYAWYSTSSSNKYWMNYPSKYWTDGSYRSSSNPTAGMKAYYYNGDHSGIVVSRLVGPSQYLDLRDVIQLESKWGMLGLYRHRANYSPYSNGINYYTR